MLFYIADPDLRQNPAFPRRCLSKWSLQELFDTFFVCQHCQEFNLCVQHIFRCKFTFVNYSHLKIFQVRFQSLDIFATRVLKIIGSDLVGPGMVSSRLKRLTQYEREKSEGVWVRECQNAVIEV